MNMMNKIKRDAILIAAFLSLLFIIFALGYSHSYAPGAFPDEFAHMGYVNDVIKHHFPDYINGLVYSTNKLNYLNHPALYYMVVGELAALLHLQDVFVSVGRYVNMVVSVFIIALTCAMIYKTTKSRLATLTGGMLLLIVPMFVVLGSAVNNDQVNILGCTLVIYGLIQLMEVDKDKPNITFSLILLCAGGVIASLSKATGSLAIFCLLLSVAVFNFSALVELIKKLTLKHILIIASSLAIVAFYFLYMHVVYGKFYPAPQGNPATWFFVDNPTAGRLSLLDFAITFWQKNLYTLASPYGHVIIIDSAVREIVFKCILIMLVIMAGFVLLAKTVKKNTRMDIVFSFIIAFILFCIVYLFTIRQMHMNSGYLGAMQARYFFGFLPVFALVLAKCISSLNSKIAKVSVLVVMVTGLVTSAYPALVKYSHLRMWQADVFVEQPLYEYQYGNLTSGRSFEQSFLAKSDSLHGVELLLSTFARVNHGLLTLELLDSAGKVIASDKLSMETLKDTAYAWFDFNHVGLTHDQQYRLRLSCNACTQDNSISWWAIRKDAEVPIFLLSKFGPAELKLYPEGESFVDGTKVSGAFAFRLYF